MDRREFFRAGIKKVTNSVVNEIDARVEKKAKRYIRPPYALNEIEFLLACTRCDDCIESCPHNVLFKLAAKLGADVAGTPAMDLLTKGCHLCEDWPCVTACKTGALKLPEIHNEASNSEESTAPPPLPRLAKVSINEATCLPYAGPECGACVPDCPVPNAMVLDMEKPRIDMAICVGCGLCREACILEDKAIDIASR